MVFKKSAFSKGKKPTGAHLETIFSNRYYYRGFNLHANTLSHWFLDDFSAIVAISFRGLLVGFGTRLSGGCTSGHGISGLASLSFTSFCAVIIFMGVAIVTANLVQLLGVLP